MKAMFVIVLLIMFQPALVYADAEMRFSGTLVEEPCSLATEDTAIEIDFGNIVNKQLYSHQRTLGNPFTLHLMDCDLSLGDAFSIIFSGIEDIEQPGLIMLDPSSGAKGVAIGIESSQGELIPVNISSPWQALKAGNNAINFQSYISASNESLIDRRIVSGSIFAIVHLSINYN